MSVAGGLLDFYILEASEYVDQLDALVGSATHAPPEAGPFITASRALRGSSTMAKLLRMAELAGSVERIGRGVRDGSVQWSSELRGAVVAAIDDLRILLRAVRTWGAAEEQRAAARIAELRRFVPESVALPNTPITGAISPTFFASEVEGVAAALATFVTAPRDRRPLDEALGRVRALRGIAALKELPPLADVADAIEHAARTGTGEGRTFTPQHAALFDAATHALRRAASELRAAGRPDASAPEVRRFADAAAALHQHTRDDEPVVPVSRLFFTDTGPHIVSRTERPHTTLERRFRAEVVAHAEHLRKLIADARAATTQAGRDRAAHELRSALRTLRATIDSFGHGDIARFFGAAAADANVLDPMLLSSVDAAATLLASSRLAPPDLAARLAELSRGHTVDRAIGAGLGPLDQPRAPGVSPPPVTAAVPTPRAAAAVTPGASRVVRQTPGRGEFTVTRKTPLTPTGPELRQFLQTGIAGFTQLAEAPLAPPAPLDDATVVSIDDLVYRGRAALERAIEVRDEIRLSGRTSDEALAELFDLLDLAATD
jgi:hypothetical protein